MKKITLTILAGLLSVGTFAQTSTPDTAIVNFVNNALKGGLMEVSSGKLAIKKGKNLSIKAFGSRMVADHSKANAELKAIIAAKRWRIASPPANVVAPDAMLISAIGIDFDKTYVNMMVKDHKKTIKLFEQAAAGSPDAQIKAFAAKTLPKLKQHNSAIQQIGDKLGIAYER
jgi:putative membrane protein